MELTKTTWAESAIPLTPAELKAQRRARALRNYDRLREETVAAGRRVSQNYLVLELIRRGLNEGYTFGYINKLLREDGSNGRSDGGHADGGRTEGADGASRGASAKRDE